VKAPVAVPVRVDGFVTMTFCAPADFAGVVHDSDVADAKTTDVHEVPPIVTVAPDTKPVPVTVTEVPPAVEPADGDTEVTVGASADVMTEVGFATATKVPPPYAADIQALFAELVRLVQVMPSAEVMTRLPVPSAETATNNPPPYVTDCQELSTAFVRLVQVMPSDEDMTRLPVPVPATATKSPPP
jgi:hypothetical protein